MTKIISFQAENVKRLRAFAFTPKDRVIVIGGRNAQGKTSVLDAIEMLLGGGDSIPSKPVRHGERKARIVADLGDIVVRRTFTSDPDNDGKGGTSLVVENKEGMRYQSPQAILDGLTGKLTFDPLAFTRLKPAQQVETLKSLVGLDFSELDAMRKKLYDARAQVNQHVTRTKVSYEAMPHHPDAPKEEQSADSLVAELEAAKEHNEGGIALAEAAAEATAFSEDLARRIKEDKDEIERLTRRIADLKEVVAEKELSLVAASKAESERVRQKAEFKEIDLQPIRLKITNLGVVNNQVRANVAREDARKAIEGHEASSKDYTAKIAELDARKEAQLAAAKFPIAGLSFGADGVVFNGIPLDQASAAEQLRVSVAIAAALNPKLKVMLIRDGSLLDDDSMGLLGQLAEQYDAQVWIERVGRDQHVSVVIEDGGIEGDVPEPVAVSKE